MTALVPWLSVVVIGCALAALFMRRRELFVLLFILLFTFANRFASVTYLDTAGPVYSEQLFRDLGPGWASWPLAITHVVFLAAVLLVFTRRRTAQLAELGDALAEAPARKADTQVRHVVFGVSALFVGLLYFDLFRTGVIPLFAGIERFEFTQMYGGRWHGLLMEYGLIWVFVLGTFYVYGFFFERKADLRFALLLVSVFAYLFLVGHRFSAFYTYTTAFFSTYAVVLIWQKYGRGPLPDLRAYLRRFGRAVQIIVGVVGIGTISVALYNSYFITRDVGQADPSASLVHRILVQPGELWYATWERVFVKQSNKPAEAFDRVFVHPEYPDRNTTVPYLMVLEVSDRAYSMLDSGGSYGGGYPEIFFELLGRFAAYGGVFAYGLITAGMFLLLLRATLERRYVRLALGWYVQFALLIIGFGGMLNFLVNWKFWLKVAALVGWMAWEWHRDRLPSSTAVASEV